MKPRSFHWTVLAAALVLGTAANAQQASTAAGAPGATTTIDGRYLPHAPQDFRGNIQTNAMQSEPSWPGLVVPSKGAPNVLLILIDDEGFAAPSTFGGVIPTPDCATRASIRRRCAHRRAPRCSPVAITTRWRPGSSLTKLPDFPATTA